MPKPSSSTAVARARALRAEGLELSAISKKTGLSLGQLRYWLRPETGLPRATARRTPARRAAKSRPRGGAARAPSPTARRRMMGRLWKAAEAQIAGIETRLAGLSGAEVTARDSAQDARALAVLARVMRDLSALDAAARKAQVEAQPAPAVRDPTTFREELARRLAALHPGGVPLRPE